MTVRALAELGLRVNDLQTMAAFYRDVIGLEIFRAHPEYVFFNVAELVEGHPQLLVLFDRGAESGPERSLLGHFAFLIDRGDYESKKERLKSHGLSVHPKVFPDFHWRSLFFDDPEGNRVEFVCYDPSVR